MVTVCVDCLQDLECVCVCVCVCVRARASITAPIVSVYSVF